MKQNYKSISSEMGELQIEESLYKSKKEMEETHLGKIEQDAEKRIGVLEKERDKYNVDKNQKMERNLESVVQGRPPRQIPLSNLDQHPF